jgi:hypothetical protein
LRLLLLLLSLAAPAHARSGEVMLAARLGAFVPQPFSTLATSYLVGVEAGWVPPVWKKRLAIAVDLSFSAPDAEGQFQSGAAVSPVVWRAALREVAMGFSLALRQSFGRFAPYLAVGPRLLIIDALVASRAGDARLPTGRESTVAVGVGLTPGVGMTLGSGQLFVEVPFAFLWRVGASPQLTGDFDPSSLTIAAGYRVFF